MKRLLLFFVLLSGLVFCQVPSDVNDAIKTVLQKENIENREAILSEINAYYISETSYNFKDLVAGIGYSAVSGTSLGVFESNAFGYTYPHLKGGAIKDYLTWNTPTDKVFGKILYPQKISREVLYISSRAALNSLKRFYGGNLFFAYATWWVLHNTTATLYRDWSKYGAAAYSLDWQLLF